MNRAAGPVTPTTADASNAEARYRTLVEQLPLVVYIDALDALSSNLYTSPQCVDLLGYTPEEWHEDAELFVTALHPADRARVLDEHARSSQAGEPLQTEYRLLTKDGNVVWVRDESVVVHDGSGQPLFRQGFLLDLTLRKETERALGEAERRYRSLVEQVPLAIYTNAPDGRLLYMSSQIEGICGYSPADLVAEPELFLLLVHPDDLDAVRCETDRALAAESEFSLEYRLVARDGSVVWILDRTSPTLGPDGRTLYRQGIVADITEEKRRDEALVVSETQFRSAFDHAPIGMALVALDGRWLRVNQSLCEIVGYSEEELLELTFQDITHPEELEADLAHVRRLLDGEARWYEMEKRYLHRDGHVVRVLLSVSLVRDGDGNPLHFISQIQDVTERHQLEEDLRQSQKMEAVGRLAGGIAHDFNNLLTAISGYSELIVARHPADRAHRHALQIGRAAAQAAQLTAQLLAFSRRQVLQPETFRFDETVAGMEELLRRLIGAHVDVRTALDAHGAHVRADRTQVEQVVVNLAVNARDAMPGGGRLTIETGVSELPDAVWAEVELPAGSYAFLEVSDTGHGMDEGTRSQVFEPFFTTKPVGDGTGLGLATVYGTVKQSGGDIAVVSTLGRGTTFRVFLPLAEAPLESLSEPGGRAPAQGTETVLLVEDEDVVRSLVRELLETRGYKVLEAAHADEALELARTHVGPIDLVVTDVVMPGMSGRVLAEQLERERPGLRVLYTSGYANEWLSGDTQPGGGSNFIQKPFAADELAAKVREILDDARAQAA